MKGLFTGLFFAFTSSLLAQTSPLNNALRLHLEEKNTVAQEMTLLVKGNSAQLKNLQAVFGYTLNYAEGDIASIRCSTFALSELIRSHTIERAELIPAHKQILNDTMYYRNRIKAVKVWTAPLPQAYDGSGILIGFIDTGIDFSHPDFKDAQGKSRIKYLWDQVPVSGSNIPQPYNYGIEWTQAQINANLCTHNDLPYYGHGTGVAGIAAGNGLATGRFEGVAPKADIIVVALDFNKIGPTIADAVNYIVSKATQLNKPFVINASLGDYYGSHDATDLEAKLIENMVKNIPGRVMVAAAGNAGHINFHTKTLVSTNDTLFTWIQNPTSALNYWCYADTAQVSHLKIGIGANRTNYDDLGSIGFKNYTYALNTVKHDTLKHNNQRIGIVTSAASINSYGVYELSISIKADSLNLLWRIDTKGYGLHHAWNFDFVTNGLPNAGSFPKIINYVKPDSCYTMVSGFQCSDEILTVANYVNTRNFIAVNNTTVNTGETAGDIAATSSSGPTRDNRPKPDVSATGNNVIAPMVLGMQSFLLQNAPQVVAQGSMHVQGGGTSAASPVVAGLAALYLQKNPTATNRQIIQAIRYCSYSDNYTGSLLPHSRWGFGKLDGKAALLCNEPVVLSVKENGANKNVQVYPNPFSDKTYIHLNTVLSGKIMVYDLNGTLQLTDDFYDGMYELSEGQLKTTVHGLLLIHMVSSSETFTFKLIKD